MTIYKKGDLLDYFRNGEVDCILHVTNCQGVMGSGIAYQIKNEFPEAYVVYKDQEEDGGLILGTISVANVDEGQIFNLNAQDFYGKIGSGRFLNYEAFHQCLEEVRDSIDDATVIGIPAKIGSDRAGGDWTVVKAMINEVFKNHTVKIVEYSEDPVSKLYYALDEDDVDVTVKEIVGLLCGVSSSVATEGILEYVKQADCNKKDLIKIQDAIEYYTGGN